MTGSQIDAIICSFSLRNRRVNLKVVLVETHQFKYVRDLFEEFEEFPWAIIKYESRIRVVKVQFLFYFSVKHKQVCRVQLYLEYFFHFDLRKVNVVLESIEVNVCVINF